MARPATGRAAQRRSDERDGKTTRRSALLAGATALAAPAALPAAPLATSMTGATAGSATGRPGEGTSVVVIAPATVLRLEEKLRERVVLQDHVLATIANAVCRWWSGLADPRLPIGSFLFLGPQGVGKTALAKALAEHLFGSAASMVRLDMGDYADSETGASLLAGKLAAAVARRPYQVLLFDEIEKVHPEALGAIQRILEAGHLAGEQGQVVDFRNTVLIMTTAVPGGSALQQAFSPAFLSRIGEIVTFNSVDRAEVLRLLAAHRASS
jgi:ATP-dependent Clp protease ATP-binding subunit ClpA